MDLSLQKGSGVIVRQIQAGDCSEWLRMRSALWPHGAGENHESEMSSMLQGQE